MPAYDQQQIPEASFLHYLAFSLHSKIDWVTKGEQEKRNEKEKRETKEKEKPKISVTASEGMTKVAVFVEMKMQIGFL